MAKKKELNFNKPRSVAPVQQEQKDNGVISEKMVYTSADIDTELHSKLKIYVAQNNIKIKDFLNYWIVQTINNPVKPDIPKYGKSADTFKINVYTTASVRLKFKNWLAENNVVMRDFINYIIEQAVNESLKKS